LELQSLFGAARPPGKSQLFQSGAPVWLGFHPTAGAEWHKSRGSSINLSVLSRRSPSNMRSIPVTYTLFWPYSSSMTKYVSRNDFRPRIDHTACASITTSFSIHTGAPSGVASTGGRRMLVHVAPRAQTASNAVFPRPYSAFPKSTRSKWFANPKPVAPRLTGIHDLSHGDHRNSRGPKSPT